MSGECEHCGRFIPRNLKHHMDYRCEHRPEDAGGA